MAEPRRPSAIGEQFGRSWSIIVPEASQIGPEPTGSPPSAIPCLHTVDAGEQ